MEALIYLSLISLLYFPLAYLEKKIKVQEVVMYLILGIIASPHTFGLLKLEVVENNITKNIFIVTLIITLAKGMLALDTSSIKKNKALTLKLSFIPVLIETAIASIIVLMYLGFSMNNLMLALLIGLMIAPVSPAIVVPFLANMINEKRGKNKDIPSIQLLAASIDDLFSVLFFYAVFIFYFGASVNIWLTILAFTVMPITLIYKRFKTKLHLEKFTIKWARNLLACTMFFLLGALLDFRSLDLTHSLLLITLVGVTFGARYLGVLISFRGHSFTKVDRNFSFVANIPKATVQASLGGLALLYGVGSHDFGILSLSLSIFMILITAPVGSYLMSRSKFNK